MFLRVAIGVLNLAIYGLLLFAGLFFVGSFVWFVFGAPWSGLVLGLLAGLLAVWFVRGLLGNIDAAIGALLGSRRDSSGR